MLRFRLFLIVIALVVLALTRLVQTAEPIRRLTNTTEQTLCLNPILSDDGQLVVFESTADLANVGTGAGFHALRVSTNASTPVEEIGRSRATSTSISRDGRKITFSSTEDLVGENPDRNSEVYLSDEQDLKQLTHTTASSEINRLIEGSFDPSISEDGTLIAFSTVQDLLLIDVETGVAAALHQNSDGLRLSQPKIGGDASWIYFVESTANNEEARDLMIFDLASHTTRTVVSNVAQLKLTRGRAVSSDGKRIVYSAQTAANETQVFIFDADENRSRQLTQLGTRASDVDLNPSISGDGKRITFATRRKVTNSSDGSVELYLLDLPTGKIEQITSAPSNATAEVISSLNHDGTFVAFNFARIVSGTVSDSDFANNSEIYVTALAPRPQFGQAVVANAATKTTDARVAPMSIAMLTGANLCARTEQAKLVDGLLPTSLANTSVTVNGQTAPLLYVSPTEVEFVVPLEVNEGAAEFILVNSDGFPAKAQGLIVRTAPGIFNSENRAIGLNAVTLTAEPFDPTDGQLHLALFATGVRNANHVSVNINGEEVPLEAVLPSTLPGLDEIHVRVPPELRGAGIASIVAKADGVEATVVSTLISGSALRDIVINEILSDPPDGLSGDANHDGARDSANDEFVELVNSTTRDLDLSGYQLQSRSITANTDTIRHRFSPGTVLPAGTALVVFGGGTINPQNPEFGGAQILRASTGGLSLNNGGGVISLRDTTGAAVTSVTYGPTAGVPGDANQSITHAPDVIGNLVLHQSAVGSLLKSFSPGTRIDGSRFLPAPAIASISVFPRSAELLIGNEVLLVAKAFDDQHRELPDVIFSWASTNKSIASVDSNGLVKASDAGSANITAVGRGIESAPVVVSVLARTPTPSPSPSPSPTATPSPSPLVPPPVVISEFRTRGPNGASDEFVEIYNNSDSTVDVSGWKLKASSNSGVVSNRLVISVGTKLPGRRHLLLANSNGYSDSVTANQSFTSGFANDGGIALTLATDAVVDQIGLGSGSAFREGMHLAPLPSDANQSYERKPGDNFESTQDTDDNFNDFQLRTPSSPQNLSGEGTPLPSPLPTPLPSPTVNPNPTPAPTATPSPSPLPSATPAPTLPPLVVSEFRTRGPNGASDEFVEIYNNSEVAVDVGGVKIRGSSNGGTVTTRLTISSNTSIPSHGHFLAVNSASYSGTVAGDQTFTSGFANDGGIAITTNDDTIIDQVGLSSGSVFKEGASLAPLSADSNQSYERQPGALLGSTQDSGDNFNDFKLVSPSDPQNTTSNATPGSAPSPTPAASPSPTSVPSPSASPDQDSRIVISQVFGGGGNSGAPFRNDFIELFNAGSNAADISGWSVQYASATASAWSVTTLTSVTLAPGHYYLIQQAGGANGSLLPTPDATGTIALAATAGKVVLARTTHALTGPCPTGPEIIDLVGYGSSADCFEGTGPAVAPSNSTSVMRNNFGCADVGSNSTDFSTATPNPRNTEAPNHSCTTQISKRGIIEHAESYLLTTVIWMMMKWRAPI